MSEGGSLINLGEISKPATVLIEKISDAIGGIFRPWQIRRVAAAHADADKIHALADIEITEIQKRAIVRMIEEEGKRQENIETITAKAIPDLAVDAKPDELEKDWLAHFFDRCKLVSDTEMQSLWARLLAGEANQPGSFSKRTVEAVATLDKHDAHLFTALCGFVWRCRESQPIVFDVNAEIYREQGIFFDALMHLKNIGLVSYDGTNTFHSIHHPKHMRVSYFGKVICIEFPAENNNQLVIGDVMFTKMGAELFPIAGATAVDGFESYVSSRWIGHGLTVYSLWPRKEANEAV